LPGAGGTRVVSDLTPEALIALRRILRSTDLNARKLAAGSGLTPSQYLLLKLVAREGRALPSAIARDMRLSQATVTALVDRLAVSGLVSRRRDSEDRRRIWVELGDAGHRLLEKAPDLLQDRFASSFARLEDWQQHMLVAALQQVAAMLDQDAFDASPVLDAGEIDR